MKVLVSLSPMQVQLLHLVAFTRGAVERRPKDVSALLREILEKSQYWRDLSHGALDAFTAVIETPVAKKTMDEIVTSNLSKKTGKPRKGAAEEAFRAAYITAVSNPTPQSPIDRIRLMTHVLERLHAQAAAAVKKARERAGFTPEGLARRAGLPVKKVESAERGYIDGEIATKLAVALKVDPHTLCPLDLWGQPKPKEPSEP